ncbi:MAG: hypothetical protein H7A25_04695 [Leptospiraceae bacterium]|nr:hypothetical protein [Leptospiraceae bacterium]MCP5499175.1 hypothetical protein [Leptospiraceae bacterium]
MIENDKYKWQYTFFYNYLEQLKLAGYTNKEICKVAWKPYLIDDLKVMGEDRDLDFHKVLLKPEEVDTYLQKIPDTKISIDEEFFRKRKTVILLVPGFTHHTLKNLSLHEQIENPKSPHQIIHFKFGKDGKTVEEKIYNEGQGLKIAYLAYPRANAHSSHVIEPLFRLIHESKTIRRWAMEENQKFVFLGYSYGSPLSLELLSALNQGKYKDEFILNSTKAFFSLCGDIGGSYLADYVIDETSKYSIYRALKLAKRSRLIAKVFGLKTKQDLEDIAEGARSLGHEERQKALLDFSSKMPSNLKYFSISSFLPMEDYVNGLFRNFDDWSMYKQALASKDISIYNDGQVVLKDTIIPKFKNVPEGNIVNLGAVRTHHWGVSYKTFNFGNNKFPRVPFYHALIKTLFQAELS